MTLPQKSHSNRRSPRLQEYDYAQNGAYFVTICIQNRVCLFAEPDTLQLSPAGKMVELVWQQLPTQFPTIELDAFVVMPNHLHGIIVLTQRDLGLPDVMQWFKSLTTHEYIKGVKSSHWPAFEGKLWQRSYYDHVVRNDDDLNRIREYIALNPMRWELDEENPSNSHHS